MKMICDLNDRHMKAAKAQKSNQCEQTAAVAIPQAVSTSYLYQSRGA
jgi:hypothetical protein